jgi:hypothetical protein
MAMSKHTPGPFEVQDPMGSDVGLWIVQAGLEAYEWSCIAIVPRDDDRSGKHFITKAEQKANAELFGAAPLLLDTLRQQKAWVNHWLDDHAHGLKPTEDSLRDALAEIEAAMLKAGV